MQRELVERAMNGDHGAFADLARCSISRLYATARLILRDEAQADDATQEALVSAWRDLAALRDPDCFEAWLHRLLVRACYREARRSRTRSVVEIHVVPPDVVGGDIARSQAERDELERGFARLNAEQRAVLVLRYYLGLSLEEAADALGIPSGTAKSRLHRAIQAMRAALDADARPGLVHEWPLA
jgi:RNA polymerase sigma-70 factor (ECF subfamily)